MKSAGVKTLKRRRLENKTDYHKRIKMLKSQRPRLVFRRTNKYIISEYITSAHAQDKIELFASSKELLKYGWPKENEGSLKSVTASYLTGYLMAKKIQSGKKETPIVDLGMIRIIHGNKAFAFIKGMIDAKLNVPCKKEAFPSEDRIKGKHLKKDFSKLVDEIKLKIEKK